jgi:hypothetical protein
MHFTSITLCASLALAAPSWAQTTPRLPGPSAAGQSGGGGHTSGALSGTCTPEWVPTFGPAAGTDGIVHRGLAFDDGSGPALIVVGDFTAAGGRAAHHVARWDGTQWSPMGQGLTAPGRALAVHDDGSGAALYAGGGNVPGTSEASLARWNGVDWVPVAFPGVGVIRSLASYDDSTGPALYVGGAFTLPSGTFARIVRFDGTVWTAMPGATIPNLVTDLAVHTEGGVTSLYVAFFGTAQVGAQQSDGALRWSSAGWSTILGQAVQGAHRLVVHDDGSGAALYIGGTPVGSTPRALARLVNGTWAEVAVSVPGVLQDLASIDLGAGRRLHVAVEPPGNTAGAPVVLELVGGALGTVVTNQVDGPLNVRGMAGFDPGTGTELALFGLFDSTAGTALYNVARVDGNQWRALGGNPDVQRPVEVATAFGSGAGRRWIAVRQRVNTTGVVRPFVDAWDGSGWTTLGEVTGTTTPSVTMLEVLDDGNGERLYAGGDFTAIDGVAASGVAVHDGIAWSALGAGVGGGAARCAALIDLGQGPLVVVGGNFTSAGGAPVARIASWDGNAWSALAGGGVQGTVHALVVDNSGATPVLYVGGQFGTAGGVTCNSITRWNGATWSNLGPGLANFVFNGTVDDLALFDEGQGPRLFVTGEFEVPGSVAFGGITRWDGANWSVVGGASAGASPSSSGPGSRRLLVHDDGTGRALYVAGRVDVPSTSLIARGVARWDGATWEALPGEPFDGAASLSVFDPGDGRSIMCAGSFQGSPAGDAFVARWRGCPAVVGAVYCAPAVPNSSGVGATMSALGSTLIVEDDVVLSAADLPQNSFGVFLASQTQGLVPGYNGSQGALCLGGTVGYFSRPGEVQNSGPTGAFELALDLTSLPTPTGAVPAAPGETWHFQAWYRDRALLGATSNFTPGVSVVFE